MRRTQHPMTPRQRLLCAIRRRTADRLPVTTHHVMPAFLQSHLGNISAGEFFGRFCLDAIQWIVPHMPDAEAGEYPDPLQGEIGFPESRRGSSPEWPVEFADCSERGRPAERGRHSGERTGGAPARHRHHRQTGTGRTREHDSHPARGLKS